MDRFSGANHIDIGGGKRGFRMRNTVAGLAGSIPDDAFFNGSQEEIVGIIERAGLVPSDADRAQLRKALDRLFGGGANTFSANTTLTADHAGLVQVSAASGAITIALPASNATGRPIPFTFIRADATANPLQISAAGSDTIEGIANLLLAPLERLQLISDAAGNWRILTGGHRLVGEVVTSSGATLPARYLWPDGRNVLRASYPALHALYAADGYPHGAGNGTTTFGLPDLRGRVVAGRDNLGGAAAGRLTSISGITGTTLGAGGGDERLHSHIHGVTDAGHPHTAVVTDNGHLHDLNASGGAVGSAGATAPYLGGGPLTTAGATTGITVAVSPATTGISIQAEGAGGAQNVQPTIVLNQILYAGA